MRGRGGLRGGGHEEDLRGRRGGEDERSGDIRGTALLRARDRLHYDDGVGRRDRGDERDHYDYATHPYDDRSLAYAIPPRARPDANDWYYAADDVPSAASVSSAAMAPRRRYAPTSQNGSHYGGLGEETTHAHRASSPTLESLLRREASAAASSPAPRSVRSAPASGSEKAPASSAKPRGRATPYLTESNRQDIMERIRCGEKQADLAKEYNVSRAAITNLKQRRQMLEMLENSNNAKDREEALKRRRLSHGVMASGTSGAVAEADAAEDDDSEETNSVEAADNNSLGRPPTHRDVREQTTSRLLTTLLDAAASDEVFKATATRLTRLLLEETIGWSFSQTTDKPYEPFALAFGGVEATALLTEYLAMEPASPSATLQRVDRQTSGDDLVLRARVPAAALRHGPVLVFVDDLNHELLFLVHALVLGGLSEKQIVVATVMCESASAEQLGRRFPDAHLVTTKRLTPNDDRSRIDAFRARHRAMVPSPNATAQF